MYCINEDWDQVRVLIITYEIELHEFGEPFLSSYARDAQFRDPVIFP